VKDLDKKVLAEGPRGATGGEGRMYVVIQKAEVDAGIAAVLRTEAGCGE
jgi:hypothetical protein